ncbi:MAG: alpha/beta hydrolase [Sneathiella sp.]|nr:alpha/beta hydrolase [Sneathiella sp.]
MSQKAPLGLLLLHALPLDGSMWAECMDLIPGSTFAPTLYGFGSSVEEWAEAAIQLVPNKKFIVVGCSVGASCALEVAVAAPDRIAALVLIGCKADHNPDPEFYFSALEWLGEQGTNLAWEKYWAPLFSKSTAKNILEKAKKNALSQDVQLLANGITAFHTRPSRGQYLADIKVPVAVVTGEEDVAPGLEVSAMQCASVKNSTLHIIPKCGHYVPLEQPQVIRKIILSLLEAYENRT